MQIAVLGTGMVGHSLAGKLVELGHEVMMGSRRAGHEKAAAWAAGAGELATEGSFADAAAFGEMIIVAIAGQATLDALAAAGADNLAGKVVIDVTNPLDFVDGAVRLTVCNSDSLGEQIQRAYPEARVVKSLNTVYASVMVDPSGVAGTNVFVCGNDADAKAEVKQLLESFGWPRSDILDLGDITGSRATEMYLPLWLRMASTVGSWALNIKLVVP